MLRQGSEAKRRGKSQINRNEREEREETVRKIVNSSEEGEEKERRDHKQSLPHGVLTHKVTIPTRKGRVTMAMKEEKEE